MISRAVFLGRFAVLLAVYVGFSAALVKYLIALAHPETVMVQFGMVQSIALFLIPNAIAFAITAVVLRSRWRDLGMPQILAAATSLVLATVLFMVVCFLVVMPFMQTPALVELLGRMSMVLPGILAGQLLRFARRGNPAPASGER